MGRQMTEAQLTEIIESVSGDSPFYASRSDLVVDIIRLVDEVRRLKKAFRKKSRICSGV